MTISDVGADNSQLDALQQSPPLEPKLESPSNARKSSKHNKDLIKVGIVTKSSEVGDHAAVGDD